MKNGYTIEYLECELQDLQDRLMCKPACVYHAYRDYTVSFALAVLEKMPQHPVPTEQARIEKLKTGFKALSVI